VNDKVEFWLKMDLTDLESAGAFIPKEVWDKFIFKTDNSKIQIKPRDYTK
jgi:hypothetical protein